MASQRTIRHRKQGAPQGQSKIRSFSIDSDTLKHLNEVAVIKRTSANALVNSILEQYLEAELASEVHGHVSFSSSIFSEFLTHLDNSTLLAIANKCGKDMGKEIIISKNLPMTLETYVKIVKDLICSHAKWAAYSESSGNNRTIVLWHKFGMKWSVFMAEYLLAALSEYLGREKAEGIIKISEEHLIIPLDKIPGSIDKA